jgi:hypothetical protein
VNWLVGKPVTSCDVTTSAERFQCMRRLRNQKATRSSKEVYFHEEDRRSQGRLGPSDQLGCLLAAVLVELTS